MIAHQREQLRTLDPTSPQLFRLTFVCFPMLGRHAQPSMFAMNALHNMAIAHDSIIAERVFQHHHANRHRRGEPDITQGQLVYLSTKNLMMPKGCTSKLLPKLIGPYKVL
jgi:hypothetical protein